MGRARMLAVGSMVGAALLLTGCCMFSSAPTANFSWSPSEPVSRTAVQFSDQSTGTNITSWNWDFGDGGTSSSQNPSYTYASGGSFQVRLTVTDACGKVSTTQRTLNVGTSLTGMWQGTIYDQGGQPLELRLQLNQSGGSVVGTTYVSMASSPGSGSFIGGQFRFTFQWPYTTVTVELVGTYNAAADQLSGSWYVGGNSFGNWVVSR